MKLAPRVLGAPEPCAPRAEYGRGAFPLNHARMPGIVLDWSDLVGVGSVWYRASSCLSQPNEHVVE